MSRLLRAKQAVCDIFPQVVFMTRGIALKTEKGALRATVTLDEMDEPVVQIGTHYFTRAEIEAIADYARAIDPECPEGLYADERQAHDQP